MRMRNFVASECDHSIFLVFPDDLVFLDEPTIIINPCIIYYVTGTGVHVLSVEGLEYDKLTILILSLFVVPVLEYLDTHVARATYHILLQQYGVGVRLYYTF